MKKLLMPAIIFAILLQLSVPTYMIFNKYNILKTGEEFRFRVSPVDPYDAFRGRYVSLNVRHDARGEGEYGVIEVAADGFANISFITNTKPAYGAYVKSDEPSWFSFPVDRYYMDEKLAPRAETLTQRIDSDRETYISVRVKKGALVISGLFIDGVAIEDIVKTSIIGKEQ